MKIGFTSIYAWRPHVEHIYYLAGLVRDAGHSVSFLTCDADLDACYTKLLRPERSNLVHCGRCQIGGLRSFATDNVSSIGSLADSAIALPEDASEWCRSSASTLGRFESDEDYLSSEFVSLATRLDGPTRKAFMATVRWIEREKLDAVCLFNGRMDATRGVLEAARSLGVPFVSLERSWFGNGIQLFPGENCLGLHSVNRMMIDWRDRPLSRFQALRAASHVASRFLRKNDKEWRAYNTTAHQTGWPRPSARRRMLLVPSSRNEIWGHPDWVLQWPSYTAAVDALMEQMNLSPNDVVLRCHPNWAEKIGTMDGQRCEAHYTDWALRRGIFCVASRDTTSTLGLIEQCEAIVVGGSSAALEAGMLGKQIIAIAPSIYEEAGIQSKVYEQQTLSQLELYSTLDFASRERHAARIMRQTLRFAYTMVYRVPQFTDYVCSVTTTRYEYFEGADPNRLIDMFITGTLKANDEDFAGCTTAEDDVLAMIAAREWQSLLEAAPPFSMSARRNVQRRWLFRSIDKIRELSPRGDL